MQKLTAFVYRVTGSTKLFIAALVALAVQSLWLAFTAIYPMPFDEYVHMGVIQIYARQWAPFISHQPVEAARYGDITRTASYLYHYLMSFPYRVLDVFLDSQMSLVIGMRIINILMVIGALVLFRQLFIMWKIPKRVMHVMFLLFVFTPIVPFVAAHVNYDNFVLLMMPIVMLFGTRLIIAKGDVAWNGSLFMFFGLMGMLAKETFTLLFAVIFMYVSWRLWRKHRLKFWEAFWKSFTRNLRHVSFAFALLGLLAVSGLVVERFGGNLIRYKTFIVKCDLVQPESVCEQYGPWYRNRENVRHKTADAWFGNPVSYTQHWVSKTMRGFFVPFSHTPTQVIWAGEPFGPIVVRAILPVGFLCACIAVVGGLIAIALRERALWRDKPLRFAFVVSVGYIAALWAFNFRTYLRLGEPQAIQARYWYPILLLVFLLMIKSANDLIPSRRVKAGLLSAATVLFIWGGGIAPWLVRSDYTWWWQNHTVKTVNSNTQNVLRYLVIY